VGWKLGSQKIYQERGLINLGRKVKRLWDRVRITQCSQGGGKKNVGGRKGEALLSVNDHLRRKRKGCKGGVPSKEKAVPQGRKG